MMKRILGRLGAVSLAMPGNGHEVRRRRGRRRVSFFMVACMSGLRVRYILWFFCFDS
jgi:hypothetical protein